jgi:twitching motility protein PilT
MRDILMRILKGARLAGASDIHLRAPQPPIVRLHGELRALEHPPLAASFVEQARDVLAGIAELEPTEAHRNQVDFACNVPEIGRFRVHAYRQNSGIALVLRSIPDPIPDPATLRFPPVIKRLAAAERGLILVTGATGNGKSTTIAAILELVNSELSRHVVTIEDPIEFLFTERRCTFSQRQVGRDVDTVHEGLLGAMREDPDWIFVGEIRTLEEMEVALAATEAGHVVISTLHSQDVMRAVQRIIHFYPEHHREGVRHRLADQITGIISQRLVSRRGARDRLLITEVLTRTPTVQDCIRDPSRLRTLPAALEAGTTEYGTHTFDQRLLQALRDGLITEDAARAAASNPHDLIRTAKATGRWQR